MKKRNPGMGTRKIAKKLGLSRNTIRNALKSEIHQNIKRDIYKPELEPFMILS